MIPALYTHAGAALLAGALAFTPAGNPNWSYVTEANGQKKFVQSLHNRRKDEAALCARKELS